MTEHAKHTPGPWIQDEGNPLCIGVPKSWYPAQVYNIVTVLEGGPDYTDECNQEAGANARLIAAAPDLLEALRAAHGELYLLGRDLAEIDSGWRRQPTALLNDEVVAKIAAAIARAEGQ